LWTAAELVGLADLYPGGRFPASLDADGSLHVDPEGISVMRRAFPAYPDPAFLAGLEHSRQQRCRTLLALVADVGRASADPSDPNLEDVGRLLAAVARLMPYPLLTKVVPDLLLAAIDEPEPPLPDHPSPGALLTEDLRHLASWCAGRGQPAAALIDRWPPPDPELVAAVEGFCRQHAGFGPVAWEAAGFGSVRYTLRAMTTFKPEPTTTPPLRRSADDFVPIHRKPAATVREAAVRWVEYMDLQIWYVRHAFYNGVVPLLATLGKGLGVEPWRLLFVERGEFTAVMPNPAEIDLRIGSYLAHTAYLAANGVDLARLRAIFHRGGAAESIGADPQVNVDHGCVADITLQGTGAAPGRVVGPAFVLTAEGVAGTVPPGAVLVAQVLHPYLAPTLPRLAAVVVEEGGLLQHATVLAREFGIPAVVALRGATRLIANGASLDVDGRSGRVTVVGVRDDAPTRSPPPS
jgi:phosphohistidine swiveling domain-containing protein